MSFPDYKALANELIDIYEQSRPAPSYQQLSKMFMGESFVLHYLANHEGVIHPKELSERMGVSTARIANLLNKMEEKNLIVRRVCLEDNRKLIVALTDVGQQMADQLRSDLLATICAELEILGPEDALAFIRIRRKIFRCYTEDNT